MKKEWILPLVFAAVPAFGVYEIGEVVENLCWQDVEENQICLNDSSNQVRVLLYNAGWCGPCNTEMAEISPKSKQYEGKPVKFISLSASGWKSSEPPSTPFLKEWKSKHKIPFAVAASPKDAGKKFLAPPIYIPNVVIIDPSGKLAYKEINPGVDAILEEVDRLLGR